MRSCNLLFFLVLLCLFACQQEKPSNNTIDKPPKIEIKKPFSVLMDSLLKQGGGPCESEMDCAKIRAKWPIVKHGDEKIRKILNDSISKYIIEHLGFGELPDALSLNAAMDSLIEAYSSEYKDNKGFGVGWHFDVDGKIEFQSKTAILQIDNYSFMGGAHPNYYTHWSNFDIETGERIAYSDFVKDMPAFKTLMKQSFEKALTEKLGEETKAEDFFWGEGFQLAQNFKLGEKEIEVTYNPYEAAPYVIGDISFKIPYEALKEIAEF